MFLVSFIIVKQTIKTSGKKNRFLGKLLQEEQQHFI